MRKGLDWRQWLRPIVVTVVYATAYALLRSVAFSHWVPMAGLRLCWLPLTPPRYWPALAVGEMIPQAYISYECADQFGNTWAIAHLFPQIVLAMPVVSWCRKRLGLISVKNTVNIGALLLCALVVCVLWTGFNVATFQLMKYPANYQPPTWEALTSRYFLGNYLGVLTLTPLVLAAREVILEGSLRSLPRRLASSRLLLESVGLLLPGLALLVWLGITATGDFKQVARFAMFLPVAWLGLRHGWRGVALAGTAASIGIILTMAERRDPSVMQAQAFIAFAITTLLMLGARISVLREMDRKDRVDGKLALQLAQTGLYLGELRMRQTAQAFEQMSHAIQQTHQNVLRGLRHQIPAAVEQTYRRQVVVAHHQAHRLADSLYPRVLRERGLPAAFRDGAIAQVMDELGISYQCELTGRGLSYLSPDVHTMLYRLACESVVYLFTQGDLGEVRITIRGGKTNGRRWVILRVDGLRTGHAIQEHLQQLVSRLGTNGFDLSTIRDRARIYGGGLHMRTSHERLRITLLLHDTLG